MKFLPRAIKISQKLWLSILSFSIPILMLLYFTVSGINYDLDFSRLELLGNRLLEPLNQLLVSVPQYQRLAASSASDRLVFNNLRNQASLIANNWEILANQTSAIGENLKITPAALKEAESEQLLPKLLADKWQKIRSSSNNIQASNLEQQYSELTQNIRALISKIGNNSNLILDPDLDSYYLMDITLLALPQAQQEVGEILLFLQSLSSQKQLSNQAKVKLEVYASSLSKDLQRIGQGVATSVQEDKNFYGVSPSLVKNVLPAFNLYETTLKKFNSRLLQLTITGKEDIANQEFFDLGDEVMRQGLELWSVTRTELDKLIGYRIQYYQNKRFTYLALSLTALVISGFFVFNISREISLRLNRVVEITQQVALGNLLTFVRVDSQDEIGQLLAAVKSMIQNLNVLIKQMQSSGIQVASSATELLATAKEQEKILEKLVKKMNEVATISEETAEFASSGRSKLVLMEESMQQMESASNIFSERLQSINQKAEKITAIITTITKVAAQTNLLSLNAAIEAEKAGKYGLGFAVVATEIRRLADQSAVAALDIEQMIREMKLFVYEGTVEMESFIAKVHHSVTNIGQISAQFTKIIEQVEALSPTFESVNLAIVQQIQNSLHETYIAIEQINIAAIRLRDRVAKFQVNG